MTLAQQEPIRISLFDRYGLVVPPELKHHMEIPDETGELHILPGEMTAPCGYEWSDGVEPILLELLEGISVTSSS